MIKITINELKDILHKAIKKDSFFIIDNKYKITSKTALKLYVFLANTSKKKIKFKNNKYYIEQLDGDYECSIVEHICNDKNNIYKLILIVHTESIEFIATREKGVE